jgi:hypothetical protein
VTGAAPDLDAWLPDAAVRVKHHRRSSAAPERLWQSAHELGLSDTSLLGRLVRWRIPGLPADDPFYNLFREPPFFALCESERTLISGLVGRIWTLRRDYPELENAEEYVRWAEPGTAKVLFANWVEDGGGGGGVLCSEVRVQAYGVQGRVGLAGVRPLIRGFQHLVGTDAIAAAVRRAERPEPAARTRPRSRRRTGT